MNTQNILKSYGSRLDIKLDSSEYYDYDLAKTENDYDKDVLDFTTPITYSSLVIDSSCLDIPIDTIKPWYVQSGNQNYVGSFLLYDDFNLLTTDNDDNITLIDSSKCVFDIKRRPENGWTLDFIFNRQSLDWIYGSTFYYVGVPNESNIKNYADNNLSFSFTNDGAITWQSIHYSGYCLTDIGSDGDTDESLSGDTLNNYILGILTGDTETYTGYTETYYIASGKTPQLCTTGLTGDFNITIVFDRYKHYTDCNLENDGGWNDLITGLTVNNILGSLSGDTIDISYTENLNKKWSDERDRRLGILKIYLNGQPIYKVEGWEEIIPSNRGISGYTQIFGGGTDGSGGIHFGTCQFNIKSIKYYEEPLDFLHVKHNFILENNQYNFLTCGGKCEDSFTKIGNGIILYEDSFYLTTENNENIFYL